MDQLTKQDIYEIFLMPAFNGSMLMLFNLYVEKQDMSNARWDGMLMGLSTLGTSIIDKFITNRLTQGQFSGSAQAQNQALKMIGNPLVNTLLYSQLYDQFFKSYFPQQPYFVLQQNLTYIYGFIGGASYNYLSNPLLSMITGLQIL